MVDVLIDPDVLAKQLDDQNLIVLHTSMANPATGILDKPAEVYLPGAIHFDFEKVVCDSDSHLPHTLPKHHEMQRHLSDFGIGADSQVIVYDDIGIYSAPRVWFMLRWAGIPNVKILNGGLPSWLAKNLPTQTQLSQPVRNEHQGVLKFHPEKVKSCQQIVELMNHPSYQIIDARSSARFYGQAPEPRPHLRSGHIPHSLNVPFSDLLNGGEYKDSPSLKGVFQQQGANFNTHWIFSCGSGVTACILALAAEIIGHSDWSVYDGSWSEWGTDPALPVSTEKD